MPSARLNKASTAFLQAWSKERVENYAFGARTFEGLKKAMAGAQAILNPIHLRERYVD
jgi:hypothetical protein